MKLGRDVVQNRKRALLFLLFQYIAPYRGVWTTPEAQRQALSSFLSQDLPNRTIKIKGVWQDGGNHTEESLWEAIRTGIREHGRTEAMKKNPVQSFFGHGSDAVDSDYCDETRAASHIFPRKKLETGRKDQNMDALQFSDPLPHQHTASPRQELTASRDWTRDAPKRDATGLEKEIVLLNSNWTMYHDKAPEGPRKRARRERYGFSEHRIEDSVPKNSNNKGTRRKCAGKSLIRKSPPSQSGLSKSREFQKITKTSTRNAVTHETEVSRNAAESAQGRSILPASVAAGYVDKIDRELWPRLRKAFKACGLVWTKSAEFHPRPSTNLKELYQICLGRNWHNSVTCLSREESMNSLDVLFAIVGAGLYTRVLCIHQVGAEADIVPYLSRYQKEKVVKSLHDRGHHEFAVAARETQYREIALLSLARQKAMSVTRAALEHISAQSACAHVHDFGSLHDAISNAVTAAFETGILLAEELADHGDDAQPTWFEVGSTFVGKLMKPSVNAGPDNPGAKNIDMTLLPGVDVRSSDGNWSVLVPATVHKR